MYILQENFSTTKPEGISKVVCSQHHKEEGCEINNLTKETKRQKKKKRQYSALPIQKVCIQVAI